MRWTVAAVVLVIAQGILGRFTVEENLQEGLVAAHLGLAMVLLALLMYLWREVATRVPSLQCSVLEGEPRLRLVAMVASASGVDHDRRGRLYGRDAEVRARRLPAR